MRKGRWHRRAPRRARVEMIPLIDCMFLLLTFFIYVATAMVLQRGIPVDLAHASSGEPLTKEVKPIHVFVRISGELHLEDTPVTAAELSSHLRALAASDASIGPRSPRPVVVNADKGVLHERVVEVLDLARESGVSDLVLAVEPKEGDSRWPHHLR